MSNETSVNRRRSAFYVNYDCDAAVASSIISRDVFLSKGSWYVASVAAIEGVISTSGKCAVRKITDASAPGAGAGATVVEMLSAPLNLDGTANTPSNGALVASADSRTLKPGDRLALNFSGTLTNLAGCLIQIELQPASKYTNG